MSVFLGNGDGTFTLQSNSMTGSNPAAIAVGDFNGDGILTWPWQINRKYPTP